MTSNTVQNEKTRQLGPSPTRQGGAPCSANEPLSNRFTLSMKHVFVPNEDERKHCTSCQNTSCDDKNINCAVDKRCPRNLLNGREEMKDNRGIQRILHEIVS